MMKTFTGAFFLSLMLFLPSLCAAGTAEARSDGWSVSPDNGSLRMERTLHLKAGELALVRMTASAPQGAKLVFEGRPANTHYPLGSRQEFTVQPLPTPLVAVLPAATEGEYHLQLTGDKSLAVQSLAVTTQQPDWLPDAATPSLHVTNVQPLPKRWVNTGGKYLQSGGGTVVFQLTPTWITALKGARGGLFDAYVALRMTADKNNWTTYFMIQPPNTDADNASWERSHWKLDFPLVIGDPPDQGWAPAVARFDDGKPHQLAFAWKQFRVNDANYLYTSYFADGQTWNARVTLLGDQTVAPDPKYVFLGSLGGQPVGYDGSPPAPMDAAHFLIYKTALSPTGLQRLGRQIAAGAGPAVTTEAAETGKVTDSALSNRVVNGSFDLGLFGWGGRFEDTIAGHPAHSWHGVPGTWIGVDQVWKPNVGSDGSPGLTFTLLGQAGKPISGDAFVLPPNGRYAFSCAAHADAPGAKVTLTLTRHQNGEPTVATLEAAPNGGWQTFSQTLETTPGESDWYSVVLTASGPDGAHVSVDDVRVQGNQSLTRPRPAEASVQVQDNPSGLVTDAAPVPLVVRIARMGEALHAPGTVRVRAQDFFGRVFYDGSRRLPAQPHAEGEVVQALPWPIPTTVHGLCRVRVEARGPWGLSVAECPVTIVDRRIGSPQTDPDSFWGGEWFPSDQGNAAARRLGLKWIKLMNVGTGYGWWKTLEPQPGQWRWKTTPADTAKENDLHDYGDDTDFAERIQNLKTQGVLGMMTLVGAPDWANEEPPELGVHGSFPKDMGAWDQAVRTIVGHYKGLVPAYEIWNEPGWWDNNSHLQKTKTYKDYAVLVQTAIKAIRETDPKAMIVYQFYFNKMTDEDRAQERQILAQVDAISTHNYFNDLPPDEDGSEQFFADEQKEVQAVQAAGNPKLQLWNSEGGIRAGGWHPYQSPDTLPYPRSVPFETQRRGAQFAKAALLMQAYGYSKWFYYISAGPVGGRSDIAPEDYGQGIEEASYGTPTISGGMSAVYAGLLHGAHFVKTIEMNPRVRFFVFRTPTGALTFYWGKNFGKNHGDLRLAAPRPPDVRDMMGNPVPLGPAGPGGYALPLTNLVNILRTPTVAEAERLVAALTLKALPGNDFDTVLATPFTEKFAYAGTLAGEQWYQVDLSKQANRGFADDVAGDGQGGWTDEGPDNDLRYMPTGLLSLYGVPFRILDPAANGGRSCIVLRAGPGPGTRTNRPEYPHAVAIPVGRRTNVFYFLLGVAWGMGTEVATLTVHYADGQIALVPLRNGVNVLDWHAAPLPNADDHKFVPARKDRFLYAVQWINPRPNVSIQSLDFVSANGTSIPILLSVTGHGTK